MAEQAPHIVTAPWLDPQQIAGVHGFLGGGKDGWLCQVDNRTLINYFGDTPLIRNGGDLTADGAH